MLRRGGVAEHQALRPAAGRIIFGQAGQHDAIAPRQGRKRMVVKGLEAAARMADQVQAAVLGLNATRPSR